MTQPILFGLRENPAQGIRSAGQLGSPRLLRGGIPLPAIYLRIFGITKDSAGSPLAACAVRLFRTVNDSLADVLISGADGSYEFRSASLSTAYYVIAYKAGAPDVAGTTVNILVGA